MVVSCIIKQSFGGIAQLVERLVRNEEASGSNPLISTKSLTNRFIKRFVFILTRFMPSFIFDILLRRL